MFGNDPHFLWFMLHSLREHFILNSLKAAVPGVDRNDVHRVKIAMPPLPEQIEIAAALEMNTSRLARLAEAANDAIALLQERRAALISAAVTGKIDVRNASTAAAEAA